MVVGGSRADAVRELEKAADEMRACEEELRDAYRSGADRVVVDAARVAFQQAVARYLKAETDLYTVGLGL